MQITLSLPEVIIYYLKSVFVPIMKGCKQEVCEFAHELERAIDEAIEKEKDNG